MIRKGQADALKCFLMCRVKKKKTMFSPEQKELKKKFPSFDHSQNKGRMIPKFKGNGTAGLPLRDVNRTAM